MCSGGLVGCLLAVLELEAVVCVWGGGGDVAGGGWRGRGREMYPGGAPPRISNDLPLAR